MEVPYEVLTLMFARLSRRQLVQVQHANRAWNRASEKYLYSDIVIHSIETARLYVRTISRSPDLAKRLLAVNFINFFKPFTRGTIAEKEVIWNVIVRSCHNINRIMCYSNNVIWTLLMDARGQNFLKRLTILPKPETSLATIWLNDDKLLFGAQLSNLRRYRRLCDEIDEFNNLQDLRLTFHADKHLSYFDGLIDQCPHLNKRILSADIQQITRSNERPFSTAIRRITGRNQPVPTILPRPEIKRLECNLRLINAANQLEIDNNTPILSGLTIARFIRYTISVRVFFRIQIDITINDLVTVGREFRTSRQRCKNLIIYYHRDDRVPRILVSANGWNLALSQYLLADNPYVGFFSDMGGEIRTLTVNNPNETSDITDLLFTIIEFCPLLENITLYRPLFSSSTYHLSNYPFVKKLSIEGISYPVPTTLFNSISLAFSNLRKLHLKFYRIDNPNFNPIVIDMPHTSLELLTWEDDSYVNLFSNDVYFQLNTETYTAYYVYKEDTFTTVDQNRFASSSNHIQLYFTFKHLEIFLMKPV